MCIHLSSSWYDFYHAYETCGHLHSQKFLGYIHHSNSGEEAEHRQVSLNAISNQALDRFVKWYRHEQRTRMVSVTAPVLKELLDRMTVEEIENIAKTVGKNTVDNITR